MMQHLQILIDEHSRIRNMLSCFEVQLGRLERAETPDYEILGGSIAYAQEYLDVWHHPREDALLELLQRRASAASKACLDLENQHLQLARTTKELVAIFAAVQRDAIFERAPLVDKGRILLRDYHFHLDWEEAHFFPVVADKLIASDWQEIDRRFSDACDPLAQNPVDKRYRALFIAIGDT